MKIAPDVPQWLLDIFNKVDFTKVNFLTKNILFGQIDNWIRGNLVKKSNLKTYSQKPGAKPKNVSRDMDQDLLNMMNEFDWVASSPAKLQEMKEWLNNNIYTYLPRKK